MLTAIETGMRWGELAALRPRHLDLTAGIVRVEETIVEVSKKDSPTGQRMMVKAYPKDNEPRTLRISTALTEALHQRIRDLRLTDDDLLFASTRAGGQTPMSRNTFRTRAWVPATRQAGLEGIRVHDLRHAQASWLLAGGADLKTVMDRLGHTQIQTTQKYLHTLPDADDKSTCRLPTHQKRTPVPVTAAKSRPRTCATLTDRC